jgi:hypothetical protein
MFKKYLPILRSARLLLNRKKQQTNTVPNPMRARKIAGAPKAHNLWGNNAEAGRERLSGMARRFANTVTKIKISPGTSAIAAQ